MNGWMDRRLKMDGWMDECTDWLNGQMDIQMFEWMAI